MGPFSSELPHEARNALWNITYNESMEPDGSKAELWIRILYDFHTSFLHRPADDFRLIVYTPKIKNLFLNGDYNRVFDFLQFALRHGSATTEFFLPSRSCWKSTGAHIRSSRRMIPPLFR